MIAKYLGISVGTALNMAKRRTLETYGIVRFFANILMKNFNEI